MGNKHDKYYLRSKQIVFFHIVCHSVDLFTLMTLL